MAGGSKQAVYAAIAANSVVTVAKGAGFLLTGSGSLLAETVHSIADVGNQTLLAIGMHRATTPADAEHPDGYGREAFVWSLISAVGIFFLGCGVSIMHGIQQLLGDHGEHADPTGDLGWIAMSILAFSFVAEGASLLVAVRASRAHAAERGMGWWPNLVTSDDPFEVAVLMEDSAAVLGVVVAFIAVALTSWTGLAVWDAIGTITIGVLLGVVAIALIQKNKSLLVGRSVGADVMERIDAVLDADPAVESVATHAAVVLGTEHYSVRAELEFDGQYLVDKVLHGRDLEVVHESLKSAEDLDAFLHAFGERVVDLVGDEIDRIEAKLRRSVPRATHIEIEPD